MTSTQVVETSVNVISNSPSQDYTHPDDHTLATYDMTPGFKPFTVLLFFLSLKKKVSNIIVVACIVKDTADPLSHNLIASSN